MISRLKSRERQKIKKQNNQKEKEQKVKRDKEKELNQLAKELGYDIKKTSYIYAAFKAAFLVLLTPTPSIMLFFDNG